MRIGLFTDSYRPAVNGVVYVVESAKRHLEALGHEVFIFCPARSMRPSKHAVEFDEDEHVIRFPSIKGAFFDDYDTSLFFPPYVVRSIKELNLDVIHFFTPGQVGLMAAHAAFKLDIPIVAQHCTDLREYVKHYKDGSLLPGLLALVTLMPFTVRVDRGDVKEIFKLYRPRRERVEWNIDIVERIVTMVYSKCDAVIALSRKSQRQLESWQTERYRYEVTLKPDGVDALPRPTKLETEAFRAAYGINVDDTLITFVGRLGAEKNLDLLVRMFKYVGEACPRARLLFVGDFEYRETLEAKARRSPYADRITFTGMMPRDQLGTVYAASTVFAFPSLTDTQAWVLHEATHAGLPIVMLDKGLSEVVSDGENGSLTRNDSKSFAQSITMLLQDDVLREQYGHVSKLFARRYTELKQIKKLEKLYQQVIATHVPRERTLRIPRRIYRDEE